jgi:hypothetical protein
MVLSYLSCVENRVYLSRGVQVTGATCGQQQGSL